MTQDISGVFSCLCSREVGFFQEKTSKLDILKVDPLVTIRKRSLRIAEDPISIKIGARSKHISFQNEGFEREEEKKEKEEAEKADVSSDIV